MSFGSFVQSSTWNMVWGNTWQNTWSDISHDWQSGISSTWNSLSGLTQTNWGSLGSFNRGFGSSFISGAVTTAVIATAVALAPPAILSSSAFVAGSTILGCVGAAGIGFSTGAAITGMDLFGNSLSWQQRGEYAGSATLGWGMLGWGAVTDKSFQPYWKYTNSSFNRIYNANGQVLDRTWLTRGISPPYGNDYVIAKDKLQLPNMPNSVNRIKVNWGRYVAGPRQVQGNSDFGSGGD